MKGNLEQLADKLFFFFFALPFLLPCKWTWVACHTVIDHATHLVKLPSTYTRNWDFFLSHCCGCFYLPIMSLLIFSACWVICEGLQGLRSVIYSRVLQWSHRDPTVICTQDVLHLLCMCICIILMQDFGESPYKNYGKKILNHFWFLKP